MGSDPLRSQTGPVVAPVQPDQTLPADPGAAGLAGQSTFAGTQAASGLPGAGTAPGPTVGPMGGPIGSPAGSPAAGPAGHANQSSVDEFLSAALRQRGDRYVMGASAALNDPNPKAFDCAELTRWAAHQAGATLPDGSWMQYLKLKQQGMLIPVDEAVHTPGALLFRFSNEPKPGGLRPSESHVAISLGNGKTIEAR
jgi:cell wall-associated NlpC family hydrolase